MEGLLEVRCLANEKRRGASTSLFFLSWEGGFALPGKTDGKVLLTYMAEEE